MERRAPLHELSAASPHSPRPVSAWPSPLLLLFFLLPAPDFERFPPSQIKEMPVSHKLLFRMMCLLLVWGSVPVFAQQFSAEMVRQKPQGAANSKVSVSGTKVRLDTEGQAQANYAILNLSLRQSSMVLPTTKSYVVSQPGHLQSSIPFFIVEDPENACPAWEKSMKSPGTCKKVGDDTVNDRSAVKYTATSDNGETGTVWVDRKLHFVIKWEGDKSAAELKNIQEGPQSASLFLIPTDYEKIDPSAARAKSKKSNPQPMKPR